MIRSGSLPERSFPYCRKVGTLRFRPDRYPAELPGPLCRQLYFIKLELTPEGSGTKLVFDQAGHPEHSQAMLEGGWSKMYWSQ